MHHVRQLFPFLIALVPACALEEPDPTDDTSVETSALTGTSNPVDCGFDDGRTCKSTTTLANGVNDTLQWDPCFGGAFNWSATVNFEPSYDRACVGGKATAGSGGGCSAGAQLAGAGTFSGSANGAVTLGLATDSSVASAGITKLTATCNEPQFIGVFRASAAGTSQQVVFGQDWSTFTSTWGTKSGQGLRLSKIETYYDPTGTTRFDGVFTSGSGGYGLNAGMDITALRSQTTTNATNGMELSDLSALQTAGGVVYVAVYRAGTRSQKIYDGLVSNFWAWADALRDGGYEPTQVEQYYDASGNHRYTAVMTQTQASHNYWAATVGVEYPWFAHEWKRWRDLGMRLTQIETHVVNGVRYYDGFFAVGGGAEDFIPGARATELDAALARDKAAGLELIDLDRPKLARTAADATLEDKLARTEYPVVAPEWMARAENEFYSNVGVDAIGYTVALMKDGRLLGASSQGYAQSPVDGGVRLTADAQWDYLSVSKWITSLAAAKVAEENGLTPTDLDNLQLIKEIAPQLGITWQSTSNANDFWHITVSNAMNHMSNLHDGGCDNGPAIANWDMQPGPAMQYAAGRGNYSYSGFDACFLRLWVEKKSGMTFERYVDTHLFRPNGIQDLDCKKDPEKVEVLQYWRPDDTQPGRSEPNTYCAAAGFKGTPLQMLKILQMVRKPGTLLGKPMLDRMRIGGTGNGDEWTFYQDAFDTDGDGPDAYGYSMSGGRNGMATHIAQFPANPTSSTDQFTANVTATYATGIDAVFFVNSETDAPWGPTTQWASVHADPNP